MRNNYQGDGFYILVNQCPKGKLMNYIGIDNGTTGTMAAVGNDMEPLFMETPVRSTMSYTKKAKNVTRLDLGLIVPWLDAVKAKGPVKALIERPMINPMRFAASISAARSLEAMLIALEKCQVPYEYIDSKQWQKPMLPSGIQGSSELKRASMEVGLRLFPMHSKLIMKHKDADALLIAEWARKASI